MRLIDADALYARFKKHYFDNDLVMRCAELEINGMPTVCDIEQIKDEIAKCIHDKPHDEFEQGVNIGLEDAIDIIDRCTKGE